MENNKYKIKIENGPVEGQQLAIIQIPSTLHSIDANHIVTTADEIYDLILKKRQSEINEQQSSINAEQERLNNEIKAFIKEHSEFKHEQNCCNSEQDAFHEAQKIINTEQKTFNEGQSAFNKKQEDINDKQADFNEKQHIINRTVQIDIDALESFDKRQTEINERQAELNSKQNTINKDVRLDIDALKLNFASASGDLEAIKEVLKNYVTEDDFETAINTINNSLKNYYTKQEVDEAIENAEVDLSGYYTKEEVDEAIENVEVDLTSYYTKSEVDDKFLALEIEEMLKKVSTSMSISPSGAFETGTEVNITVTYKVNGFTLSDKSQLSLNIIKGGNVVASGTGETITYTDKITKSTSYSGNCSYKNGVKTWSSNASKSSYYRTYYGFGLNEEDVFKNGKSKITSSASGTYADTAKVDNVYYYIIVPSGVSCPSTFTMNATPFVMYRTSMTKNNISYTVLKSGSAFGIGGEVNINAQ